MAMALLTLGFAWLAVKRVRSRRLAKACGLEAKNCLRNVFWRTWTTHRDARSLEQEELLK